LRKYDPLGGYLRRQKGDEVTLSFFDIERLVGLLPKSAQRPQWWTNETMPASKDVQCRAWLDAKWLAFPVCGKEQVTFRRE
jgi:hypothetical protein